MATPESPVESIFFEALAKASAEERAVYLTEACAGNPELRRRIADALDVPVHWIEHHDTKLSDQ